MSGIAAGMGKNIFLYQLKGIQRNPQISNIQIGQEEVLSLYKVR